MVAAARRPAPAVVAALARGAGSTSCGRHQAEALDAACAGPTIVTTGTASGKSLCFQPADAATCCAATPRPARCTCTRRRRSRRTRRGRCTRSASSGLQPGDLRRRHAARAALGDPAARANLILTNPDMLHLGILPNHRAWARLLRQPRRGRGRRGARLPRRVRLARGERAAAAAAGLRRLRRRRRASCWLRRRSPTRASWPSG